MSALLCADDVTLRYWLVVYI